MRTVTVETRHNAFQKLIWRSRRHNFRAVYHSRMQYARDYQQSNQSRYGCFVAYDYENAIKKVNIAKENIEKIEFERP